MSQTLVLGLDAMRTRFELVLHGAEPAFLRAAGDEALREIAAVEQELSIFRADSALNRLHADLAAGPSRAPAPLRALLRRCQELHAATDGAFDPGVGSQLDRLGLRETPAAWEPVPADADAAPARGIAALRFHADGRLSTADPQLRLDLGGIGKGVALDRAVACLREAGVPGGLLHGGGSSVLSFGEPPERTPSGARYDVARQGWRIAIAGEACLSLREAALSISATRPRGRARPHLIDPSSGRALDSARTAAVLAHDATTAEAWSTACLVRQDIPFRWLSLL